MTDTPAIDCAALQLSPSACAELLEPAPIPPGAGWLILAMLLAVVAAFLLPD